ncbi:hypothetical protein DSO57_1005517 [Entomophthora muscae]|uniref:Uncharacterized protein n=1 Tax=Entomophthora muscae TaxID=34485 RepID=A0ACC2SX83_9FUNG|nr:hypothetical protein DSO57_1005517 [Entomophthora muscae]
MVTVPIGLVIAGLNLGALAHQIGNFFSLKWVPDIYTKGIGNNEVTYTSTVYPVVTQPRTLDPRVATSCPRIFDTSYEPLTTTKEQSELVMYSTINSATTSKSDPTFYTKVPIPCVEPDSQDAAVPTKGWHQLTDSEREALLNCLNRGMAV